MRWLVWFGVGAMVALTYLCIGGIRRREITVGDLRDAVGQFFLGPLSLVYVLIAGFLALVDWTQNHSNDKVFTFKSKSKRLEEELARLKREVEILTKG